MTIPTDHVESTSVMPAKAGIQPWGIEDREFKLTHC
jgi:hypothetical protein